MIKLQEKIVHGEAVVCVIGLGYVGLPLLTAFVRDQFRCIGLDINEKRLDEIREGTVSVVSKAAATVLQDAAADDRLSLTSDPTVCSKADVCIICVPTPTVNRRPDISHVLSVVDNALVHCKPKTLIVLESTVAPTTTRKLIAEQLCAKTNKQLDHDFFFAFSPEREDPGNKTFALWNTPKLVGGVSAMGTELALSLYSRICDKVHVCSSSEHAELAKLFENTFRAVNIALANELKDISTSMGIDPFDVLKACDTKPFGFMKFTPGPGVGGECIPDDPYYLLEHARSLGVHLPVIETSMRANDIEPFELVTRVLAALAAKKERTHKLHVVGLAYKPGVGDLRNSPALEIFRRFLDLGLEVTYEDPYVPQIDHDGETHFSLAREDADVVYGEADIVLVLTNHTDLDFGPSFYENIEKRANLIGDARGVYGMSNPKVLRL